MFLPPGWHLASQCRNESHFGNIPLLPVTSLIFPTGSTHTIRCFLWGNLSSLPVQISSDFAYSENQVTLEQPRDEYSLSLFSCAVDEKCWWQRTGWACGLSQQGLWVPWVCCNATAWLLPGFLWGPANVASGESQTWDRAVTVWAGSSLTCTLSELRSTIYVIGKFPWFPSTLSLVTQAQVSSTWKTILTLYSVSTVSWVGQDLVDLASVTVHSILLSKGALSSCW